MIPASLSAQVQRGLADFLRQSFASTTPGFQHAIDDLVSTPGGVLKGPFVQVFLPFVRGARPDFFPRVPLPYTPYVHQERAFQRLSADPPQNTLVATGTGSGKTESFLWPILAHSLAHAGQPGIKAILIYPMNALAADQALRLGRAIYQNPHLRGAVTAGLYIGESDRKTARSSMGPEYILTEHSAIQHNPPDILLTNYKMLDYLLVRPRDRHLWRTSGSGSLRFLVVDELHSFDGAQGTDLSCLLRRVKDRLHVRPGQLVCVGTSATLGAQGGGDRPAPDQPVRGERLLRYAAEVFGEHFPQDAVLTETRQTLEAFRGDTVMCHWGMPTRAEAAALDPALHPDPAAFLRAQAELWLGPSPAWDADPAGAEFQLALGAALRQHVTLDNLLRVLRGAPRQLDDLVADLAPAAPGFRQDPAFGRLAVLSFLGLVSCARAPRHEHDEVRAARLAQGGPVPTEPLLQVRVQLWQRELARMVANVAPRPSLRFSDDLPAAGRQGHLPVVHCRECGAMGWAAPVQADRPNLYGAELPGFYRAYFADDTRVHFLFPIEAAPQLSAQWIERRLHRSELRRLVQDEELADDQALVVADVNPTRAVNGRRRLLRDCPFCEAYRGLTLLGFRAATLTSVYIDQIFASRYNDDKKLLAFSDAVQDASHRAGFFGARTWRFNVRVALQQVICGAGRDLPLPEVAPLLVRHFREERGLDVQTYVATFLAPNMLWLHDYDALRQTGHLPEGAELLQQIRRRLAWEVYTEYGLQARIGRSLPRSGCSAAGVNGALLGRAVEQLLPTLQNEIGGLRGLPAERLRRFLCGVLVHLQERGGILHEELPDRYVDRGDTYAFHQMKHLPDYGPGSRLPALLSDRWMKHCDVLLGRREHPSWYERWYRWCFEGLNTLVGEAVAAYRPVLQVLTELEILESRTTSSGAQVWGLRAGALPVSCQVAEVRCGRCGRASWVTAGDGEALAGAPCLSGSCEGTVQVVPREGATQDYFGRLYQQGDVARIFAEEHTGLLKRSDREELERRFKAERAERRPWDPNLLSCTPTLEMGIDVGDLSVAVLCSIPPAQANYVQRIGRAGRKDGNALVLAVANNRNHDLYFYAAPEEMIAGAVAPPGVYLNAPAVLERQLTAYCFDRWAAGAQDDSLPTRLHDVLAALEPQKADRFPHNLRRYVEARQAEILAGFLGLFGEELRPATVAHLRGFLQGGAGGVGAGGAAGGDSVLGRMLTALREERRVREGLSSRLRRVLERIRELRKAVHGPEGEGESERDELEQERSALRALISQMDQRETLAFLTEEGLLPNYAFPEAPVHLRSVIWRKRVNLAVGQPAYETWTYEWERPGAVAIAELAPENEFYAGGRKVQVDQVDVGSAELEQWRFCDECSYSERVMGGAAAQGCPSCGSRLWPDPGRVHRLLRLLQVYANSDDRRSRVRDERDEREPKYYYRQMLASFRAEDREAAWQVGEDAFAFELLRRATFREINFGSYSGDGQQVRIAGRTAVRRGFLICKHCGKVQADPGQPVHALSCVARGRTGGEPFAECVYLYREFSSEAVRFLLPVADFGSERQLHSFVAALQVGLRAYFRGQVEHLATTLSSEPVPDAPLRRQYLLLYDRVPGGTGYLKELLREPRQMLEVLRLARELLVGCSCAADPTRDGCYRCIFMYRNSFDMQDTSRRTAVELLSRILDGARERTAVGEGLRQVASLGDVSVAGLVDSVLELRFLEALRRLGRDGCPSILTQAMVAGKPGYRWSIGGQAWNVELQKQVEATGAPGLSVDFVFHPVRGGGLPVAVFLDGWKYHRERLGLDFLQRAALRLSGRYDVWSFTWADVAQGLGEEPLEVPALPFTHLITICNKCVFSFS